MNGEKHGGRVGFRGVLVLKIFIEVQRPERFHYGEPLMRRYFQVTNRPPTLTHALVRTHKYKRANTLKSSNINTAP